MRNQKINLQPLSAQEPQILIYPFQDVPLQLVFEERVVKLAIKAASSSSNQQHHLLNYNQLTNEFNCLFAASPLIDEESNTLSFVIDEYDQGRSTFNTSSSASKSTPISSCLYLTPTSNIPGTIYLPARLSATATDSAPSLHQLHTANAPLYANAIKQLYTACTSFTTSIDTLVSLFATITYKSHQSTISADTGFDLITISNRLHAHRIHPLPIITTALSKALHSGSNGFHATPKSGFCTPYQQNPSAVVMVLESDPKVNTLPLIGIWVSGVNSIKHPMVWAACLRYMFSNRALDPSDPSFAVILYPSTHKTPEFYKFTPTNPSSIEYTIFSGQEKLITTKNLGSGASNSHLISKSATENNRVVSVDLIEVKEGYKLKLFTQGLNEALKHIQPHPVALAPQPTAPAAPMTSLAQHSILNLSLNDYNISASQHSATSSAPVPIATPTTSHNQPTVGSYHSVSDISLLSDDEVTPEPRSQVMEPPSSYFSSAPARQAHLNRSSASSTASTCSSASISSINSLNSSSVSNQSTAPPGNTHSMVFGIPRHPPMPTAVPPKPALLHSQSLITGPQQHHLHLHSNSMPSLTNPAPPTHTQNQSSSCNCSSKSSTCSSLNASSQSTQYIQTPQGLISQQDLLELVYKQDAQLKTLTEQINRLLSQQAAPAAPQPEQAQLTRSASAHMLTSSATTPRLVNTVTSSTNTSNFMIEKVSAAPVPEIDLNQTLISDSGHLNGSNNSPPQMVHQNLSMQRDDGLSMKTPRSFSQTAFSEETEASFVEKCKSEALNSSQKAMASRPMFEASMVSVEQSMIDLNPPKPFVVEAEPPVEVNRNLVELNNQLKNLKEQMRRSEESHSEYSYEENVFQTALKNLGAEQSVDTTGASCYMVDTAMLPRVQYVSMCLDGDRNQSLDMNSLAMKYLKDEQLKQMGHNLNRKEIAIIAEEDEDDEDGEDVVKGSFDKSVANGTFFASNNLSMASKQYMEKYGILNGGKPKPVQMPSLNSSGVKINKKALGTSSANVASSTPALNAFGRVGKPAVNDNTLSNIMATPGQVKKQMKMGNGAEHDNDEIWLFGKPKSTLTKSCSFSNDTQEIEDRFSNSCNEMLMKEMKQKAAQQNQQQQQQMQPKSSSLQQQIQQQQQAIVQAQQQMKKPRFGREKTNSSSDEDCDDTSHILDIEHLKKLPKLL